MNAASLAEAVGIRPACRALGVARSTIYRRQKPTPGHQQPSNKPARALDASEHEAVRDTLASERIVDRSPAAVGAALLDEGNYLCSERTLYRTLAKDHPVREHRDQLTRPPYMKPELVATAPNQTWSWEFTRPPASARFSSGGTKMSTATGDRELGIRRRPLRPGRDDDRPA